MFTVRRLGVPDRLARTMSCTNIVESMISVVPRPLGPGEELARRDDGAQVGRHRDARGRALLPPGAGCKDMASSSERSAQRWPPVSRQARRRPAMPSRNVGVTARCAACGEPLPDGRARRWCSDACRQAAWRLRHQPELPPPQLPAARPRKAGRSTSAPSARHGSSGPSSARTAGASCAGLGQAGTARAATNPSPSRSSSMAETTVRQTPQAAAAHDQDA